MKKKLITMLLALALTMTMLNGCGAKASATAEVKTEEKADKPEKKDTAKEEEAEEAEPEVEEEEYVEEDYEESDSEEADDGSFTLLDVDESMIDVGAYGSDTDGTELVFTMFTGPDGNHYVSLFDFDNGEQSGDVICGQYEAETEVDEDGDEWTYFDVEDVYTGDHFSLGVCERPSTNEVAFFNANGDVIEGQFLTASETIDYMASAVNLIS